MPNRDTIDFLLGAQGEGQSNLLTSAEDDPEQAARAIELGRTTGVNPALIFGDLDNFELQTKVAMSSSIVSGNPHLRSYVDSNPMAAKVSNDDYGQLDAVSESLAPLTRKSLWQSISEGWAKGVGEGPLGSWIMRQEGGPEFVQRHRLSATLLSILAMPIEAPARYAPGAYQAIAGGVGNILARQTGQPEWERRAEQFAEFALDPGVLASTGIPPLAAVGEVLRGFAGARPWIAAGKEPPVGLHPLVDKMKVQDAETQKAALKEALSKAVKSATRERAPDMFADFVGQHSDETIGIPADVVLELYGGKEPTLDDGILGWVPRLREQMQAAVQTGGDLQIPLADWLAKVDPTVAKAIEDRVRVGEAGVTVEEGKGLKPTETEPASDIEAVREAAKLPSKPFASPPGWMTVKDFDRYMRFIERQRIEDLTSAEKRAAAEIRERESVDWKEKRREVQAEVAPAFARIPAIAADDYFREGMLYGKLVERPKLGDEFLSDEMKEILPKSFVVKYGGVSPDDVAGLFGFAGGPEMVAALGQMHIAREGKPAMAFRRKLLEEAIDREMESRYGNFSEKVLEEAKDQAASETAVQYLHEEILAAAERAGLEYPIKRFQLDSALSDTFENSKLSEVNSDRFLRESGRVGRALEEAHLADDKQEAFRQRQRQYAAAWKMKEAVKLEKERVAVDKLANRFAAREVSGVAQEFTDFIQLLLRQAGIPGKKTMSEIAESISFHGHDSLAGFVDEIKADGYEPVVADWLGLAPKAMERMTVGEFRDFKDALDSLAFIGRKVKKIEIQGREADFADWKETKVLPNIESLAQRSRESNQFGQWYYRMDAALTRMEEIVKDLDLRQELGPLFNGVIVPMMQSKAKEFDLLTETAKYFKEVRGEFGREWRKTLGDAIPNVLLIDPVTRTPYDLSRENLIQIMLNWGSRSNIEKFTQGYASLLIGRKATSEEGAILETRIKTLIDKHATKEDWQFVQAMWEPFRKLQPEADKVSRNVSGVAPKWIEPAPIETPHGTFEGAYYPVKYDRLGSNLAVIEDKTSPEALFGSNHFRAATAKGYLKERTGYVDFVDINTSIEAAAGTLQQMIHDISFRDAVVQANKIFSDKQIRGAIRNHYGTEYEAQLQPWLKRIANRYTGNDAAVKWANDWMRRARINTIGHVLPLNLKVILSPDIGAIDFAAWSDYAANRTSYTELAMEKSSEIRHLVYNMDRDFREQMEAAFKGGRYTAFQREAVSWAFLPMMKFSQEFRVSTFVDKYQKALGEGKTEAEASHIADSYVRERHGAASVVDLPAIMESSESMKIMTMFYGFFNTMYNWQRQLPGNLRRKEWDKFAVNAVGSVLVPAAFGALLFNNSKENDSWYKIIGKAFASQVLSTVPFVRDAASWWFDGFSPRAPHFGMFQAMSSLYTDLVRVVEGKKMKKPVQNLANVIGLITGLPLAQLGRTGEFAYDVFTGEQRPRNIMEWWRGVLTGEARLKKGK